MDGHPRRIRQFVDIGSGLPTQSNTHEAVPGARVAYVDHDPMVAVYAAQLLTPDGTTAVVTRDMRDSAGVLGDPGLRAVIDLAGPGGRSPTPRGRAGCTRASRGCPDPGPGQQPS